MKQLKLFPPIHHAIKFALRGRLLTAICLLAVISPASAHEFGVGKDAYEDFLSGNQAVLADLPVLLGLVAAGLLAAIWKPDGFPMLRLPYIGGVLAGAALGFSALLEPVLPAYAAVVFLGVLGALAPSLTTRAMRGLYFLIGVVLTNAVLSGHTISEVPPAAYLGIFIALNLVVACCARLVFLSLQFFPYGWVTIAWRAGSSWLVAIAIMALALMLR